MPELNHEDYRVLKLSHQRGGRLMPAELTVKWRRYHDYPGAARAQLNELVKAGAGTWEKSGAHPYGQFVLSQSLRDAFNQKKTDDRWKNIFLIGGLVAGGIFIFALAGPIAAGAALTAGASKIK